MKQHILVWPLVWILAVLMAGTRLLTTAVRADDDSRIQHGVAMAP